jgi:hypothetical protein
VRRLAILLAVFAAVLAFAADVHATTVTRVTLPSFYYDGDADILYAMTCNETQVINGNHRRETFACTFDGAAPPYHLIVTPKTGFWFSDFDGAEATDFQFVITRSGHLNGWAEY